MIDASNMNKFDRWKCSRDSSFALTVFKRHNREVWTMYTTFEITNMFLYKQFGNKSKETWDESIFKYFYFKAPLRPENSPYYIKLATVRDWSDSLSEFMNWTNLNTLLVLIGNLETYIAKISRLAMLSDFGVLFGYEKNIEGVHLLKYSNRSPEISELIDNKIIGFTRGDWQSRINNLCNTFINLDKNLLISHISNLEKIRKIRNNLAHSFGRDIDESQKILTPQKTDIAKLSRKNLFKYSNVIYDVAKHLDNVLLNKHIGSYEYLNAYHETYKLFSDKLKKAHVNIRADKCKKEFGKLDGIILSKRFWRELAEFYERV